MKNLKPQLVLSLREYSKEKLVKDLVAGVIVAIIALPLSIALALASGVSPEQGLYTAIVAGFLISALGGSKVQIAGPTAAFATIVAGIVAKNGMEITAVIMPVDTIKMGFVEKLEALAYKCRMAVEKQEEREREKAMRRETGPLFREGAEAGEIAEEGAGE